MTAGEQCDDSNNMDGDGCSASCLAESGCSALASFSVMMTPDIWICAFNNQSGKTWPETYGVCNEAAGFYLASVGPMTRRGVPDDASIAAAMAAANANSHDFITTGHPARACTWDSTMPSYESCNGLGYLNTTGDASGTGPNWVDLTDGNENDLRNWHSANTTGAHNLASMCMNASNDPMSVVFDHRWR